jgi:hypothetical protein
MRFQFTIGLLLGVASFAAAAQAYRCSSGDRTYFSDRPCNGETKLQQYGPVTTNPRYTPSTPGAPKAQPHVKYLNSGCASISEAIRTGPARGVRGDVIQGLHEEYRQKCALDDQDARAQAQQDLSAQRQTQIAQRDVNVADKQLAKERADRCNGMRDVISLKRRREAELNVKEVEALRSLEKTYNEVCIAK